MCMVLQVFMNICENYPCATRFSVIVDIGKNFSNRKDLGRVGEWLKVGAFVEVFVCESKELLSNIGKFFKKDPLPEQVDKRFSLRKWGNLTFSILASGLSCAKILSSSKVLLLSPRLKKCVDIGQFVFVTIRDGFPFFSGYRMVSRTTKGYEIGFFLGARIFMMAQRAFSFFRFSLKERLALGADISFKTAFLAADFMTSCFHSINEVKKEPVEALKKQLIEELGVEKAEELQKKLVSSGLGMEKLQELKESFVKGGWEKTVEQMKKEGLLKQIQAEELEKKKEAFFKKIQPEELAKEREAFFKKMQAGE